MEMCFSKYLKIIENKIGRLEGGGLSPYPFERELHATFIASKIVLEESAWRLFKILPSRLIPSAWDQLSFPSPRISIGRSSGRKGTGYRLEGRKGEEERRL